MNTGCGVRVARYEVRCTGFEGHVADSSLWEQLSVEMDATDQNSMEYACYGKMELAPRSA